MLDDPFAEEQIGRGKVPAQHSHGKRYIVGRGVTETEFRSARQKLATADCGSDLVKLPL